MHLHHDNLSANCVEATSGFAFYLFLSQWSGA